MVSKKIIAMQLHGERRKSISFVIGKGSRISPGTVVDVRQISPRAEPKIGGGLSFFFLENITEVALRQQIKNKSRRIEIPRVEKKREGKPFFFLDEKLGRSPRGRGEQRFFFGALTNL